MRVWEQRPPHDSAWSHSSLEPKSLFKDLHLAWRPQRLSSLGPSSTALVYDGVALILSVDSGYHNLSLGHETHPLLLGPEFASRTDQKTTGLWISE